MVASLPVCAAILSNHNKKYLSYIKEGGAHKHLRFSSEEIVSRSTKFAIERSSKNRELVHLRCCHNNKYLVKQSEASGWIIAAAEKPEDDISLWSSTLFEPIIVEKHDGYGRTILRFKHVQTESYICLSKGEDDAADSLLNCLHLGSFDIDYINFTDVVTLIDWDSLVIMPKRVAFKSCTDGKYLVCSSSNQRSGAHPCIRPSADNKAADGRMIHEVFTNPDGTISIKSNDVDGFWTSHEDGEMDVEPLLDSKNQKAVEKGIFQTFVPIKLSSNEIALRCTPLNKFCLINGSAQEVLCNANSILRDTMFEVEEVVISREVNNIEYHLEDARIYDESTVVKSTYTIYNSAETAFTSEGSIKYQDKRSSAWTNGGSLSLGVPMNLQSEGIPLITENGIVTAGAFVGPYDWGTSTEAGSTEKETAYRTTVPPMTQAIVSLVSIKGTCDVPFSYIVRDDYIDGTSVKYHMNDGVYTGVNFYKLHTKVETNPI